MNRSVLVLGLFLGNKEEKSTIRTAEERISSMFSKNNIATIVSSSRRGKMGRLLDTMITTIVKRREYDTAIVPLFGTWPSFLWQELMTRILKALGKKIVLGIHGGSIPGKMEKGSTRFSRALERASVVVAPSDYMAGFLSKRGFRVKVIENPVDLSQYTFTQKATIRPRILWMRAFTDIYNPKMAVRVAVELSKKYADFQMIMAGKDGPLTPVIKQMVKKYGLEKKIHLPGYIDLEDKLRLASDFDIYICTNRIDNAPVSLVEFMALGLPVVSVNAGGIPYMIKDRYNGLLVNGDDEMAMCRAIDELIENPEVATSIIMNANAFVQRYDEKNIVLKWKELIYS